MAEKALSIYTAKNKNAPTWVVGVQVTSGSASLHSRCLVVCDCNRTVLFHYFEILGFCHFDVTIQGAKEASSGRETWFEEGCVCCNLIFWVFQKRSLPL